VRVAARRADLRFDQRRALGVEVGDHDGRSGPGEGACGSLAHAVRAAGHEHNPAGEVRHRRCPCVNRPILN
jgi:hypothetical protein